MSVSIRRPKELAHYPWVAVKKMEQTRSKENFGELDGVPQRVHDLRMKLDAKTSEHTAAVIPFCSGHRPKGDQELANLRKEIGELEGQIRALSHEVKQIKF